VDAEYEKLAEEFTLVVSEHFTSHVVGGLRRRFGVVKRRLACLTLP
jgi:hypothetical protein